ncbi:MAG TPA: pilus assembly protein TadG-related protein [Pyrinomonadaceae bacterium]|nr:pilus assembly protein TadG-related protein [Pyrinomonadaceae bacterium]
MKNLRMQQAGKNKRERGSILATSAIGMLSILLAVGLGVDISRFYLTKTELQNAADAAALAAVSGLNTSSQGITKAADRAVAAMNNYNFNHTSVSFPRGNVEFAANLNGPYMSEASAAAQPAKIRFVKVTTPASAAGVSFAASVLGNSKNLTATATAGFSVPLNEFCNWLPVSVIDYGTPIMPGTTYTFRAGTQGSVSPGNYQILAVAGRGGADVRVGLAAGVDECAGPGATYEVDTKPGVNSGPVRQGINTRFDDYQTSQVNPADMPPDKNIKENITYDQYKSGSPSQAPKNPGVDGRRVVVIPIVKEDQYDSGRNTVTFDRFGVFFLQTKVGGGNGGELVAEYVDDIVLGQGGFNPNGGPVNNLMAVPVLYR